MEFTILDNGFKVDGGRVRYQWFQLADPAGAVSYRAVALRELTYLPIETRDDPDMLGKQWAAVRGLYNANADFLYTAFGVFQPDRLGVVQCYGAAAEHAVLAEAAQEAQRRLAAVEATLANYPQSRTVYPDLARLQLLTERLQRLPKVLAILGHPDPRLARRGLGRDGAIGQADDELLSQQGENLLRGLARLSEDFVFLVTAAHIPRPVLTGAMVKMAQLTSQVASRQRGSIGVGFSLAVPLAAALSNAYSQNVGRSESHGVSSAETVNEGWSVSESESWGHSTGHGTSHGTSHTESSSVSDGISVGTGTSQSSGWSTTDSTSNTQSGSTGTSWSHTDSVSDSTSHSTGVSESTTTSHATGVSSSESSNWGQSTGASSGWSSGSSHSDGVSAGTSQSTSSGTGTSHTNAASSGTSHSTGDTQAYSSGASTNQSTSNSHADGWNVSASAGVPGVVSASGGVSGTDTHASTTGTGTNTGVTLSSSASNSTTQATSTADSTSASQSTSQGASTGTSSSDSTSQGVSGSSSTGSSVGGSASRGTSESWGTAHSRGTSESWGTAHTVGSADSVGGSASRGWATSTGRAEGVSGATGTSTSIARSHSVSSGVADSESWGESTSESWSEGKSVGRGQSGGRSHGVGISDATGTSLGAGRGVSGGLSAGLVPGVSISRGWQTEDDVAIRLTDVMRGLESLLNTASHEGGFLTTALLLATVDGERAAQALVPQSFHGSNVPTPVLTRAGGDDLRSHALAFRPSFAPDGDPFGIPELWTLNGTLLTPAMVAAYTAPNLFEEGTAVTIQEKLPPLAFYPELAGEVVLGHQVSPETGDLTATSLALARPAHFHTAFVGDTGYGKSVAAVRLAYETTLHWQLKTIVLDFGMGWRQLLNAPGLAGHVEIRQLSPGGVRPLRWNPLQVGRNILPEVQWRSFSDIFGTIAQLGGKRQIHELREILRKVYLAAGVLVDDPEVRNDPAWGTVRPTESGLAGAAAGTPLGALSRLARQAIAVERSRQVGFADLYRRIDAELNTIPPKDIRRSMLEGINFRLKPLVQGEAGWQYGAGAAAIDINELVPGDWGIAVLEGGAFLDEFSKAFLLGWAAWQLYTDAVILRTRSNETRPAHMQIVFEEANKILAGLDNSGSADDGGSGQSTADQFAGMWRDSRKYGIWLHLITQSPSLIPPGILASCNNLCVTQIKNGKDQDTILPALARSPKGLVDEPWRRFLGSIPIARAVVKLGYQTDRARLEPCYVQPLLLNVPEPTDADIAATLGELTAAPEFAVV